MTDVALRALDRADLAAVHALSQEAGWPHRVEDWRFALDVGSGVVAMRDDGSLVGSAMAWRFGPDVGTVGMIIVSRAMRSRGLGRRLLRHAVTAFGAGALELNATAAGLALYASEGFAETGRVVRQHQGLLQPVMPLRADDVELRPAAPDDPAILALDREAYGADRGRAFRRLPAETEARIAWRHGAPAGFALCRPFGRGHVVGPVVAPDDSLAAALASALLEQLAGRFVRMDLMDGEDALAGLVQASGLAPVEPVVTMRRGDRPEPEAGTVRTFALLNQAMG
ncbi:GNAT family N-acetyltransferase [Marinivivus vitaminiproducens]|uniref:GNAT family N-acetyltransferase n=1 Tax=Marinivivus vitaminiproducens TaxID=3035935 RepID=UPI00279ECEC6|nr:GNAT family N-acetyltransferase [Geminicoccaceae bacterium SCSIO 64248]